MARATTMYEELWAGVNLKAANAGFFLEQMGRALLPPPRTTMNVALQSTGAIIGTQWQAAFYAYLDAFLAMSRSVPEVITCCFGEDRSIAMKSWFKGLDAAEQSRRRAFSAQFETGYSTFRALPLSTAGNITLHRTGHPPVEVRITGFFGVSYEGSAIERVPTTESSPMALNPIPSPPVPLQPNWEDFKISGVPLFPECQAYLREAHNLVEQAGKISQLVHGGNTLTSPL
jgi:hypothetical protein